MLFGVGPTGGVQITLFGYAYLKGLAGQLVLHHT